MKQLTDKDIELHEATQKSIYLFAEYFLKHLLLCDSPEFHLEVYKTLPAGKRLVLASPRGFAKSTIVSVIYPIWLSLWGGAKDICIISASETLAVDWLRKIKFELCNNSLVREYFGEQVSDKWSENHIILRNGVNIRARGAGGQIRGFRPDVIICDDLETDDSVRSEEQRKQLKDWLFKACLNTLVPEGQFIIVGTIIHPLSVLADLLAMDNGWTKKKYMAYQDGVQTAGHELWPLLWSHDRLQARKKEIGSFAFSSEFMNSPISDETAPIKESQIRCWTELPKMFNAVIAVDPAYSEDDTADWKTACLILCDQAGNRFLAHYIRTHDKIGEFQDAVINMWLRNRDKITAIGVPNSGVEKAFFESFLRKCQDRKYYPPVMELKNAFVQSGTGVSIRNKTARVIAALQPLFEQGKYYIGADMLEARDELMSIGVSRHDDIVDCMTYAENLLQPYYGQNTTDDRGNNVEMQVAAASDYGWGLGGGRDYSSAPVDITIGG
jgi:phage terminase large subunit-like protein